MKKRHAACIDLRLEMEKEPEGWNQLHVGGTDGTGCQHLQVMMTRLLQKHLGVAGGQEEEHVARQRKETHDVLGPHGHQDGLRRSKMQSTWRKLWVIQTFTDGLQRLCYVQWQARKVRRPSKKLTAVSTLRAASVKEVLKLLGCGKKW